MGLRKASTSFRKGPLATIVIPTLNEEKNLPLLFKELAPIRASRRTEILIVDGFSTDKTVKIAERNGARVLFDRVGKGSAIIKGLSSARGNVIVIMDADCSHAAGELPILIGKIEEGYDVSMGSRFMPGGGSGDITLLRFIGNKFFVSLVNVLWRTGYTDLCYGYRAFSRGAARALRSQLESKGFGIETEISIKCAKLGLAAIEVPSYEKPRFSGESRLKTFRDGFIILKTIAKERLGS
ncbi:MAG: glycosyltransferase family 2 protein [archaeon]